MTDISYNDFAQVELRVGTILSAEEVEGSDKLLRLEVDFDEGEPRQIVSGIRSSFADPETLVDRQAVFVTNIPPREMMGLKSDGMIIAAREGDAIVLISPDEPLPPGTRLG